MGKMGVQTNKTQHRYMIKAAMGCLQDTKNEAILHLPEGMMDACSVLGDESLSAGS